MKIAYCMRVDVFDKPGGDLHQIKEYIRAGQNRGADGKVLYHGEVVTDMRAELSGFDIIHLTNIDRPVEASIFSRRAQAAGKPVVISSIHHAYSDIERYEREGRGGLIGLVSGVLGFANLELLRSIVRSMAYPQLLRPTLKLALRGIRNSQASILEKSARIFVLTHKEKKDIIADFGISENSNFELLRNGLQNLDCPKGSEPGIPRVWDVCVVARIEARKNQIAILNAVNELGLRAVFVGAPNENHGRFCDRFKRLIGESRSDYLGAVPYEQVSALMRAANIHVSASWFEVSSLVDLEAYLCGCCVVSSACGGTKEILGENAIYVDPGFEESIISGIAMAMDQVKKGSHISHTPIGDLLPTWDEIGIRLVEHYAAVLAEAKARTERSASLDHS